jgi:hypothetical protein
MAAPRPAATPISDDSSKATGGIHEGTAQPAACEPPVPDWFKPAACPGCQTPFPSEYWTHREVPCQRCGKWELNTGAGWSPLAGRDATGRSIASWMIHPPQWRRLLPQPPSAPGIASSPVSPATLVSPSAGSQSQETSPAIKSAPIVSHPEKSEEANRAKLSPSRQKAYGQFLRAVVASAHLNEATDREVYAWVADHLDDNEPLPEFSNWSRYLREARAAYGDSKNKHRAGRSGRSIVRPDEI